jgi:hypothetical protein
MAGIKITIDSRATRAALGKLANQIPFAMAQAINATAKQAAADANAAMPSIFNRANAFTRQAVGTPSLATKGSLSATVAIKPLQAQYLGLEILGGTRTPAGNTRLPSQALVLPGQGTAPLPSGLIKRLAAQAQADQARRQAVAAGMRKRGKLTGANAGVFKLSGHGIRPSDVGGFFRRLPNHKVQRLVAFEPSAQYKPKFQFERQVTQTVNSTFAANFDRALARALTTAK